MSTPFELALASFQLGESETHLKLNDLENFCAAQKILLTQCQRTLCIVTPHFEAERFNNDEFVDSLSAFARRSRLTSTHILVGDPTIAVRWGHRVVRLTQRISSKILIRQTHAEYFDEQDAWIVADGMGLLRRDTMTAYKGMVSSKAIPQAQRAQEKFIEMWERSHEIPDFRNLHI